MSQSIVNICLWNELSGNMAIKLSQSIVKVCVE